MVCIYKIIVNLTEIHIVNQLYKFNGYCVCHKNY
jgi:hypothetical protein